MNHKISISKFLGSVLFLLFIVVLCFSIIPSSVVNGNIFVIITFLINAFISLVMLVVSSGKRLYSLETTHWIFYFFFFVFAPMIQFSTSKYPVWLIPTHSELINTNILLTLWALLFALATNLVRKTPRLKTEKRVKYVSISYNHMIILMVVSIVITLYKLVTIGFLELLSRSTAFGEEFTFSSIEQLFTHSINAIVILCFAFACIYNRREKHRFILFVSTLCMVICIFPTGTARYNAATVYFAAIMFLMPQIIKGRRFTYLFILGLIVVFPLLDAFRRTSFAEVDISSYFNGVFSEYSYYFTEGHYDAYAMIIRSIRHISSNGITWGFQLLGNILFFIPRSIWTSKPIGTGAMIMTELNADFTNVSAPLPAEGIVNFGYFGMLLFAIVLGVVVKKFDDYYWFDFDNKNKGFFSSLDVFYCYFVSLLFFILRGDLMSSTAYTAAYFVVCYLLSHVYFQSARIDLPDKDVSVRIKKQ